MAEQRASAANGVGAYRSRLVIGAVVATLVVVVGLGVALVFGDGNGGSGGSGGDASNTAAAKPCDATINVASYYRDSAVAHVDTQSGTAHAHDHGSSGASTEAATGELAAVSELLAHLGEGQRQYDAWLAGVGTQRDPNAPDDTGRGGHVGPTPWTALSEPAQCKRLADEIGKTREIAARYPKGRDAKAAGWVPVTPYVPGIAAHFMRFEYVDGTFELDKPEMLLYDGIGDDANVLGLSYMIRSVGDREPAQGFTGPNDHYHRHIGLCVRAAMVIGDTTTTPEACAAMGGAKADGRDQWMNHVWSVPGCESPWGMFSGISPVLDVALGSRSGQGSPCSGSESRARYDLTPGYPAKGPGSRRST